MLYLRLLRISLNKNKLKFSSIYIVITAIAIAFTSCKKNEVEVPATYTFEREGETTVSFIGQTQRIAMAEELIAELKNPTKTAEALLQIYANATATGEDANPFIEQALNQSTKSIKSKVAASKDFFSTNTTEAAQIKTDFETWMNAQVNEIFTSRNELAAPGKAGQIADGTSARYVNAKGLEYNQAISKGLIGALMVDQILNNYLSIAVLDEADNKALNNAATVIDGKNYTTMEHKWDEAYGYLFGAASNAANPFIEIADDSFLYKYLMRVNDDEDFSNFAKDIYNAFKLGRAAIIEGNYELRDEQANLIRDLISQVVAIRAIYYLQQGKKALPTNDSNNYGPAFHDLSEGYGFIYSLRFTRKPNTMEPYFTKVEVDSYLNELQKGNGFWEVDATTLDDISNKIAVKFSFTVAEAAE